MAPSLPSATDVGRAAVSGARTGVTTPAGVMSRTWRSSHCPRGRPRGRRIHEFGSLWNCRAHARRIRVRSADHCTWCHECTDHWWLQRDANGVQRHPRPAYHRHRWSRLVSHRDVRTGIARIERAGDSHRSHLPARLTAGATRQRRSRGRVGVRQRCDRRWWRVRRGARRSRTRARAPADPASPGEPHLQRRSA